MAILGSLLVIFRYVCYLQLLCLVHQLHFGTLRIGSVCSTLGIIHSEFWYIYGTFVHFTLYKLYLNPHLKYNYFRFGKTDVRHLEILLLVSISTISLYLGCHSASDCRILSKSDHLQ